MAIIRTKNYPYLIMFADNGLAYLSKPDGDIECKSKADELITALSNFYDTADDEFIEYLNHKAYKDAQAEHIKQKEL